jgi:hypothetical protein
MYDLSTKNNPFRGFKSSPLYGRSSQPSKVVFLITTNEKTLFTKTFNLRHINKIILTFRQKCVTMALIFTIGGTTNDPISRDNDSGETP